jgi:hypothetical protein
LEPKEAADRAAEIYARKDESRIQKERLMNPYLTPTPEGMEARRAAAEKARKELQAKNLGQAATKATVQGNAAPTTKPEAKPGNPPNQQAAAAAPDKDGKANKAEAKPPTPPVKPIRIVPKPKVEAVPQQPTDAEKAKKAADPLLTKLAEQAVTTYRQDPGRAKVGEAITGNIGKLLADNPDTAAKIKELYPITFTGVTVEEQRNSFSEAMKARAVGVSEYVAQALSQAGYNLADDKVRPILQALTQDILVSLNESYPNGAGAPAAKQAAGAPQPPEQLQPPKITWSEEEKPAPVQKPQQKPLAAQPPTPLSRPIPVPAQQAAPAAAKPPITYRGMAVIDNRIDPYAGQSANILGQQAPQSANRNNAQQNSTRAKRVPAEQLQRTERLAELEDLKDERLNNKQSAAAANNSSGQAAAREGLPTKIVGSTGGLLGAVARRLKPRQENDQSAGQDVVSPDEWYMVAPTPAPIALAEDVKGPALPVPAEDNNANLPAAVSSPNGTQRRRPEVQPDESGIFRLKDDEAQAIFRRADSIAASRPTVPGEPTPQRDKAGFRDYAEAFREAADVSKVSPEDLNIMVQQLMEARQDQDAQAAAAAQPAPVSTGEPVKARRGFLKRR